MSEILSTEQVAEIATWSEADNHEFAPLIASHEALRVRLAEVEQALRIAAEQCMVTTDDDEMPWLIDRWMTRARAVLDKGSPRGEGER